MARKVYHHHENASYNRMLFVGDDRRRKKYGIFSFLFDCVLTAITGGLWLIWIFVREMRKR